MREKNFCNFHLQVMQFPLKFRHQDEKKVFSKLWYILFMREATSTARRSI